MKRSILILGLMVPVLLSWSQVNVTAMTPDEAVQSLLGPNVVYSNATFTGIESQLGYMTGLGAPTNFEIASGIVLCADEAITMVPGQFGMGLTPNISGDPDLLSVANSVPPLIGQSFSVSSVNNIAALEFDFVATGDYLSFNYIFGSDEYLEWVNSTYNDVFAFFLSGPGITGPYDSPPGFPDGSVNIAFVPGTDPILPITISSVNDVMNSSYYVDNVNQVDVACDGYTVTMVAEHELICGETYHIKLAIADGSDQALKSLVVLQEGSFNIGTNLIQPIVVNAAPGLPELSILEGCVDGQFIISPPACLLEADTVQIIFSGTATNGTDYTTNGVSELILLPEQADTLDVSSIADSFAEGTETITISFTYTGLDGTLDTASATLNLIDYVNPGLQPINDFAICPGETENVTALPTGGFAPFAFEWSTGQTSATVNFGQGDAGNYTVSVTDFCGNSGSESFVVTEPAPFDPVDSLDICLGALSESIVEGGALPYTFDFDETIVYQGDQYTFGGLVSGETVITVTDACDQSADIPVSVEECDTTIPNVFTPNKDGKNDTFEIFGVDGFPNSTLIVYNRWGTIVFESGDYRNQWSGNDLPEGVYYYIFKRSDGENYEGYVHLLRK